MEKFSKKRNDTENQNQVEILSTFKDFSNLNPGFPFLTRFIENIQVDVLNFSGLSKKHKIVRFNGQINFDSCSLFIKNPNSSITSL